MKLNRNRYTIRVTRSKPLQGAHLEIVAKIMSDGTNQPGGTVAAWLTFNAHLTPAETVRLADEIAADGLQLEKVPQHRRNVSVTGSVGYSDERLTHGQVDQAMTRFCSSGYPVQLVGGDCGRLVDALRRYSLNLQPVKPVQPV